MKLNQAIAQAKKYKSKLRCNSLCMREQTAKTLVYWLFSDNVKLKNKFYANIVQSETTELVAKYLAADDWELETMPWYHLRVVTNSEAKLMSFISNNLRQEYISRFVKKHGIRDDKDANWIDMEFEGTISDVSKTVKVV